VLYNCGEPEYDPSSDTASGLGLVAKGDGSRDRHQPPPVCAWRPRAHISSCARHMIFANTIFRANASEMCLSSYGR
jgi:hypothetical protein